MFDFSMGQLALIGITALVCIGPKELPGALRAVGKLMGKARGMAREFQTNVDDMMRDSEIDELKKQVQKLEYGGLEREFEAAVDPKGELKQAMSTPSIEPPPAAPTPSVPAAAPAEPPSPPAVEAPKTG
jgi:sec-independent protein translocase protein TatB